ncbi:unnamed protein product [Protopolystoma xenopodis]|uniref:Uncharacterized protein n=1 Tax=Protopolystoma xenopodis TaxID=117903 RepID=A0A448XA31_9PLAT|nr:unnamed protein product [Protopolystoma xenopodis]
MARMLLQQRRRREAHRSPEEAGRLQALPQCVRPLIPSLCLSLSLLIKDWQ